MKILLRILLAPPGETMAFKLGDEEDFRWVAELLKQLQIFIDTLSATCRLPGHEIMKKDCKLHAICNQTKYNEEKRGGDIYGKNGKCICTC